MGFTLIVSISKYFANFISLCISLYLQNTRQSEVCNKHPSEAAQWSRSRRCSVENTAFDIFPLFRCVIKPCFLILNWILFHKRTSSAIYTNFLTPSVFGEKPCLMFLRPSRLERQDFFLHKQCQLLHKQCQLLLHKQCQREEHAIFIHTHLCFIDTAHSWITLCVSWCYTSNCES